LIPEHLAKKNPQKTYTAVAEDMKWNPEPPSKTAQPSNMQGGFKALSLRKLLDGEHVCTAEDA
jgi:hypothetical protein